MELQGRDLGTDMQGDDVNLLHDELTQLGYTIPDNERQEAVFGPGTEAIIQEFQQAHGLDPTGVVDQNTATQINQQVGNQPPAPSAFVVQGQVTQPNGNPVSGARVRAIEKRLLAKDDVNLGETQTNATGQYLISYNFGQTTGPDLLVQILDQTGQSIASSPLIMGASAQQTIDLVIQHESYPDLPETDQVRQRLQPFLAGESLAALDKDSIAYLAGKARLNPVNIAYLSQAERLSASTGIQADAFYALFCANLPVSLPALVTQDKAIQKQALEQAVAANIVGPHLTDAIDGVLAALDGQKVDQLLQQPELPVGQASLSSLLDVATLSDSQKQVFATLHAQHTGNSREFWTALRQQSGFDNASVASVQLSTQLGILTLNNLPLMTKMHEQLQGGQPGLRDLAGWDEQQWLNIIRDQRDAQGAVIIPPNLPQIDGQEPDVTYAHTMRRVIEDAYPTPTLAANLNDSDFNGASGVRTFLAQNADFEFRDTNIRRYLVENNINLPANQKAAIEATQRLFDISPRFERYQTMRPLLSAGITSAYAIYSQGEGNFKRAYTNVLDSDKLAFVYQAAGQKVAMSTSLFTTYSPLVNNVGLTVIPSHDVETLLPNYPELDFPTWESLFGRLDFCACEHCRSVYSPAAYLVDVLAFLRKYQTNGKSALAVLFDRRGDLGKIELNCHNTLTELPYVDLVNEVLEHYLANAAANSGSDWWDASAVPQTTGQTEALRAHPEHINTAAYTDLENTDYPWTLPFSLWAEEARAYLEPLAVRRDRLMRYFNPDPLDALPDTAKDAIAAEHLGLIARERAIILGNQGSGTASWGGTSLTLLRNVKTLMERGRLSFLEVRRLLDARFINPNSALQIVFPNLNCNLNEAHLPALQLSHLDQIQRLMRLQRKLGWDIHELDAALHFLSAGNLDDAFLRKLSGLKQLRESLNVPILPLLSWYAPIDTTQYKNEEDEAQPSLYDTLFLNKSVGATADLAAFTLNSNRDELAVTNQSLDVHEAAVLAGLQLVSADELDLIRQRRLNNNTLNLANLSELHRVASLARSLKLSVRDLLDLLELSILDPFDSSNIEATLRLIDQLMVIRASGFTIAELTYILYHQFEANSHFVLTAEQIGIFLLELRSGLQKIQRDYQVAPDETVERTTQLLAQVLAETDLAPAQGLIYGLSVADMPDNPSTFIDNHFASFISDLPAVKDKLINTNHTDYLTPGDQQTERFQVILVPLLAYLQQASSVALVKQTFADFLEIDLRASDLLVGSLMTASSNPSQPASAEFLNNAFINSSQSALTEADFGDQFQVIRRLHKVAILINQLNIPSDELTWLVQQSPQLGWLDLNTLPVGPHSDPSRFQAWLRMAQFAALRDHLPVGEPSLFALLRMAHTATDDDGNAVTANDFLTQLCARTRWDRADVDALLQTTRFNLTFNSDFQDENALKQLVRLHDCFNLLKQLGVAASMAWNWAVPTVTRSIASEIKQAARAKYDQHQWLAVAEPIREMLRQKQRTTLVDAVLHQVSRTRPGINDTEDLFGFFLMDVEMTACMLTSRIKQAMSSVQLFVQRCLMNLEPEVTLGNDAAQEWQWMKNYRVWEANRKIFLYPENWTEPELRLDKSPFFLDLENELLQNDVTKETAETAFLNYLEKLDGVARLEVASLYQDEETKTLHVIARTKGIPHHYYYRRWEKSRRWTPWEPVPVDIEGENVAVTRYNRRLYLFWFMIHEKADERDIAPTALSEGGSVSAQQPKKFLEIKLAWSQFRQGKWSPKRVSDVVVQTVPHELVFAPHRFRPRPVFRAGEENLVIAIEQNQTSPYPTYLDSRELQSPSNFLFINDGQVDVVDYDPTRNSETLLDMPGRSLTSRRFYFDNNGSQGLKMKVRDNQHAQVLDQTPAPYRIVIPLQYTSFVSQAPFFFEDRYRSYFVTPRELYEILSFVTEPPLVITIPGLDWDGGIKPWDEIPLGPFVDPRATEPGYIDPSPLDDGGFGPTLIGNSTVPLDVVSGVVTVMTGQSMVAPQFLNAYNTYGTNQATYVIGGKNRMTIGNSGGNSGLTQPLGMAAANTTNATFVMDRTTMGYADSAFKAGSANSFFVVEIKEYLGTQFRFHTFYHPYVTLMIKQLNRYGIDGLLNPVEHGEAHTLRRQQLREPNDQQFDDIYTPGNDLDGANLPVEEFDFEYPGAYAIYNWELFFHTPLLIAVRLSANQQFSEAQKWFHYIFDPTDVSEVPPEKHAYRFWKIKPFYENTDTAGIEALLRLLTSNQPADQVARENLEAQVADWRENPFQPHLIAQQRWVAYQKAVVMKYLDNLIAWGDHLFRRDTIESINEATQLYILAAQILGKRPEKVPGQDGVPVIGGQPVKTFDDLTPHLDAFSNVLVQLETELSAPAEVNTVLPGEAATAEIIGSTLFFCIPQNEQLLSYWDTVADRLFKIRHCMNIEGVVRQLNLFEPPIDPALLVRATAAGIDLSSVLNDLNAPRPHYRFGLMLQTALELSNDVKQLGSALLAALEKQDAEALALLRSGHEALLLKAVKRVREDQLEEASRTLEGLEQNLQATQNRQTFYATRQPRIANEKLHLDKLDAANTKEGIAQGLQVLKTALTLIPQFDLGASGFGGSPVVKVEFGGIQLGDALDAASQVLSFLALLDRNAANRAAIVAGYDRRQEEWDFQASQAATEIEALKKQIEAAKLRLHIAERELENQELQIAQNLETDEFMRLKFSNRDLYHWMLTQISTLYFQSYQLAYDMSKRAQQALRHELADYDATFIEFGYWDSLKKGLLAGDRLYYDLKRMEIAYYERHQREYELTKHIALMQLNPTALIQLRESGTCEIDIPEVLFDLDYPGHYLRRIKSVSLSIPCVTGPYTNVNCTLTLLSNRIRVNTQRPTDAYTGFNDTRFLSNVGGIQSIATSSAREDSGLFEFNFRDERYLPFEGAGVISRWRLELPADYRQFDYDTISDVVLHVRYTARDGGFSLKSAILNQIDAAVNNIATATSQTGLFHFISLKHAFGTAFYQFLNPSGTNEHQTTMELSKAHFPFLVQHKTIDLGNVLVFVKLRDASLYDDTKPLALTISRDGGPDHRQSLVSAGQILGGLAFGTYTNLNGNLAMDESWRLTVTTADVQQLPDALKHSVNVDGNLIPRITRDEIEDIGLLLNYSIT